MSRAAVTLRGVRKRFGYRDALCGVTADVPSGACTALLGANGSGKTTLLRIVATLSRANEGEIEVLGHTLPRQAAAVRGSLGVVARRSMLPARLRLRDSLAMYADLHGVAGGGDRIEELAVRAGLETRLRDPVRTLSRGLLQRAALCRALLHRPRLLLLDEPYVGLDAVGRVLLDEVVAEHTQSGGTTVLVTHDLERAGRVAQHALVLSLGRLVHDGDAAEAARVAAGVVGTSDAGEAAA